MMKEKIKGEEFILIDYHSKTLPLQVLAVCYGPTGRCARIRASGVVIPSRALRSEGRHSEIQEKKELDSGENMENATFECSAANWWLSNCPSGEFSGPLRKV
jgi:hypothetical protein